MTQTRLLALLCIAAAVLIRVFGDVGTGKALVAALFMFIIMRSGLAMISGLAQPVPEPPEPGELRKVKLTYRCELCGAEVRMTAAPSEDPEPPRHCMEDMELVTSEL